MNEDLIKRGDAIKAIEAEECLGYVECQSEWLYDHINAIPSADRPQGEWIDYKDEHTCSVCKEVVIDDWYYEYEWYDFCPHCGASMKGADDE